MTTSVFPLYKKTYTLPAYFAVVLLLSSLCFGNLKDHLYFTHDDEIQQDYPHPNADPAFFFSPDKANVSGRPIGELVMWAAYAAWGNNPAFFHLLSVKDLTFARWQRAAALIDKMEAADRDHGAKQVAELRQQIHLGLDNSRHALRLRPDANLYYAMGRIYQYQQRLGDALTAYEQTLRQDPAYRRAFQRMAEIFALQGDRAAADRILQALSEHTGTPAARSER
jgi:tetratricopeptide (TPR) repeat protein